MYFYTVSVLFVDIPEIYVDKTTCSTELFMLYYITYSFLAIHYNSMSNTQL